MNFSAIPLRFVSLSDLNFLFELSEDLCHRVTVEAGRWLLQPTLQVNSIAYLIPDPS